MYYYNRNLKDFEFALTKIDDWIVDLKDQRAEIDDLENYIKEVYEVMYEFETIGQRMERVMEYADKIKDVEL